MSGEAIDILERAGDYCAKLAAIDHAHILGNTEEFDYLLSGVDPIDARLCANVLRELANELRGGSSSASAGDVPAATATLPAPSDGAVTLAASGGTRATAPEQFSVKVPCS